MWCKRNFQALVPEERLAFLSSVAPAATTIFLSAPTTLLEIPAADHAVGFLLIALFNCALISGSRPGKRKRRQ